MHNTPELRLVKGANAPVTAASLIAEAHRSSNGDPAPLEELILYLPEGLRTGLDAVLSEFDYRDQLGSNAAIGCRVIAALISALEYRLQEVSHD